MAIASAMAAFLCCLWFTTVISLLSIGCTDSFLNRPLAARRVGSLTNVGIAIRNSPVPNAGEGEATSKPFIGQRIILDVPFADKDTVRDLGARWDPSLKGWYIDGYSNKEVFALWIRHNLAVPFAEKEEAKSLGAQWDANSKQWYVTGSEKKTACAKWLPNAALADGTTVGSEVLFLGIETSGVPMMASYDTFFDPSAVGKYDSSRVIQLCLLVCKLQPPGQNALQVVEGRHFVIRATDFEITNSEFHGIDMKKSAAEGVPFSEAAAYLAQVLDRPKLDTIVAHNADFVMNVLQSELHRYYQGQTTSAIIPASIGLMSSKKIRCSMLETADIVKIATTKPGVFKRPKLSELYNFCHASANGSSTSPIETTASDIDSDIAGWKLTKLHSSIACLVERGVWKF